MNDICLYGIDMRRFDILNYIKYFDKDNINYTGSNTAFSFF